MVLIPWRSKAIIRDQYPALKDRKRYEYCDVYAVGGALFAPMDFAYDVFAVITHRIIP